MPISSDIIFNVQLDENKVPEKIRWQAEDGQETGNCKATMISIWDADEKNTLKIDLWTKEMTVDEMKKFYHQSLLSMADSFERSTGEERIAKDIRDFSRYFAEELGLIERQ